MSQSDYIQHKKMARTLRLNKNGRSDLGNVLESNQITEFKKYQMANTIVNTVPTYNELLLSTKRRKFGMEIGKTCPEFAFCRNSNGDSIYKQRKNRSIVLNPHMQTPNVNGDKPLCKVAPNMISTNEYFWIQKRNPPQCFFNKQFEQCEFYFNKRDRR